MRTQTSIRSEFYELRKSFRYFSRLVKITPNNERYHIERIQSAMRLEQNEPLQGALADYFFACWYLMPTTGNDILQRVSKRLNTWVVDDFRHFVNQGDYLPNITKLATRWSVLVTPSMDVPSHQMYVGKDDASWVAKDVCQRLLIAKQAEDESKIAQIEQEFFTHCVACHDRMGFMMVWFELSKNHWQFHSDWEKCRQELIFTPTTAQVDKKDI
ncbi:hypothetical protein [Moraxella oblonga]|uniref:hypothetical protein n=1 Tax=Moraxella oblonga TaxID=200413 RepID=UPI00082CEB38|nr:hypothetical protein [Moraxella oblonga]